MLSRPRRPGGRRTKVIAAVFTLLVAVSSCADEDSVGELNEGTSEPKQETDVQNPPISSGADQESEPPPSEYIGDDAMFDFLVLVQSSLSEGFGWTETGLPVIESKTPPIATVSPPRCEEFAGASQFYDDGLGASMQFFGEDGGLDGILSFGGGYGSEVLEKIARYEADCTAFATETPSPTIVGGEKFTDVENFTLQRLTEVEPGFWRIETALQDSRQYRNERLCGSLVPCMVDSNSTFTTFVLSEGETVVEVTITTGVSRIEGSEQISLLAYDATQLEQTFIQLLAELRQIASS